MITTPEFAQPDIVIAIYVGTFDEGVTIHYKHVSAYQ